MLSYDIYDDIAIRTGGDIYLGIVGPVRTGKSTFIKKFMETSVLDKIQDKNKLQRTIDELPQSADGKTIMTTEPKFVPNEAVSVVFNKMNASVRLIDCVGYLIDEARSRGVTEISLDATQMGHPLYKSLGFNDNGEGMNMSL